MAQLLYFLFVFYQTSSLYALSNDDSGNSQLYIEFSKEQVISVPVNTLNFYGLLPSDVDVKDLATIQFSDTCLNLATKGIERENSPNPVSANGWSQLISNYSDISKPNVSNKYVYSKMPSSVSLRGQVVVLSQWSPSDCTLESQQDAVTLSGGVGLLVCTDDYLPAKSDSRLPNTIPVILLANCSSLGLSNINPPRIYLLSDGQFRINLGAFIAHAMSTICVLAGVKLYTSVHTKTDFGHANLRSPFGIVVASALVPTNTIIYYCVDIMSYVFRIAFHLSTLISGAFLLWWLVNKYPLVPSLHTHVRLPAVFQSTFHAKSLNAGPLMMLPGVLVLNIFSSFWGISPVVSLVFHNLNALLLSIEGIRRLRFANTKTMLFIYTIFMVFDTFVVYFKMRISCIPQQLTDPCSPIYPQPMPPFFETLVIEDNSTAVPSSTSNYIISQWVWVYTAGRQTFADLYTGRRIICDQLYRFPFAFMLPSIMWTPEINSVFMQYGLYTNFSLLYIVVPGMVITFARRFELVIADTNTYVRTMIPAYVVGLLAGILIEYSQPAPFLLILAPFLFISLFFVALLEGDIILLWCGETNGMDEDMEDFKVWEDHPTSSNQLPAVFASQNYISSNNDSDNATSGGIEKSSPHA